MIRNLLINIAEKLFFLITGVLILASLYVLAHLSQVNGDKAKDIFGATIACLGVIAGLMNRNK